MNKFSFALFLVLMVGWPFWGLSQLVQDSGQAKKDSVQKPVVVKKDSSVKPRRTTDTAKLIVTPDTIVIKTDTQPAPLPSPVTVNVAKPLVPFADLLRSNPYFNFLGKPLIQTTVKRSSSGKDGLFYLLVGMLLFFALVKVAFGKYLSNLFAVFFRVSLKQKQLREQLLQTPLPSMLLNIFFVLSAGLYITFLLQYYQFQSSLDFWWLLLYAVIALTCMYSLKYMVLKLAGWIFNIQSATDTYIFIVFLVNKLLGVFLIPFLMIMAFASPGTLAIMVTASLAVVILTFLYRYIISYGPVRKEIKVSQFHFFIYLCAFEITPLLLIYKILGLYWNRGF